MKPQPLLPLNRKHVIHGKLEPFLYLLPAILFFGLFTYYPFIKTFGASFFLVDSMGRIKHPAGIENYLRILRDPKFLASIANTFVYAFLAAPLSIIIALFLALIAFKKRTLSPVYETMFALTMAMSMSVSAVIFRFAYNPAIGAVNYILHTRINWLNDRRFAMIAISAISVWMNIGYNFIFLLAGVRGISRDVLESAELDGASVLRKTVNVMLPMISPTLFFLICTLLARSMMMSGLVLIFTNAGAIATTSNVETMISFMYKQAVNNLNYNDAYAAAMVAFAITFILMLISFRFERKGVYYK